MSDRFLLTHFVSLSVLTKRLNWTLTLVFFFVLYCEKIDMNCSIFEHWPILSLELLPLLLIIPINSCVIVCERSLHYSADSDRLTYKKKAKWSEIGIKTDNLHKQQALKTENIHGKKNYINILREPKYTLKRSGVFFICWKREKKNFIVYIHSWSQARSNTLEQFFGIIWIRFINILIIFNFYAAPCACISNCVNSRILITTTEWKKMSNSSIQTVDLVRLLLCMYALLFEQLFCFFFSCGVVCLSSLLFALKFLCRRFILFLLFLCL